MGGSLTILLNFIIFINFAALLEVVMGGKRTFEIAFVGLKTGIHQYEYEITDQFFENFERQDFINCKATVKLELDKQNGFMLLRFEIGGSLEVICDRCGNNLPLQLWEDFNIVVKLVDNPEEMNESEEDSDVYYISRTDSHIYLADWIYDFINLSIPMQRMCKPEEMGGPFCNKEVLAKLNKMKPSENDSAKNIWKDLEKFKNLRNKN